MNEFFKKKKIELYHTNSGLKSVKAECYIRVICSRLYRVLAALNTFSWVEHLQTVIDHYNSTPQEKTLNGFSPLEIVLDPKKALMLKKFYEDQNQEHRVKYGKPPKFLIGDNVRYLLPENTFGKFYVPQYSLQIEQIKKIINSSPPMYYISNQKKSFYGTQLQKVFKKNIDKNDLYIDESKTLKQRKTRSGKILNSSDKIFLLKSTLDPKFKKYISKKERDQLIKDAKLISISTQ